MVRPARRARRKKAAPAANSNAGNAPAPKAQKDELDASSWGGLAGNLVDAMGKRWLRLLHPFAEPLRFAVNTATHLPATRDYLSSMAESTHSLGQDIRLTPVVHEKLVFKLDVEAECAGPRYRTKPAGWPDSDLEVGTIDPPRGKIDPPHKALVPSLVHVRIEPEVEPSGLLGIALVELRSPPENKKTHPDVDPDVDPVDERPPEGTYILHIRPIQPGGGGKPLEPPIKITVEHIEKAPWP